MYFLAEILCLMITDLNNSTLYSEKSVLWTDIDTNVTQSHFVTFVSNFWLILYIILSKNETGTNYKLC